jgi:hypothetical protein
LVHAIADHVLVRFIWRGAGRGPQADLQMTAVYTVRKGRVFLGAGNSLLPPVLDTPHDV